VRKLFNNSGFTQTELLLTMGIFVLLSSFAISNLLGSQRTSSLTGAVDTFVADVREQQVKAMVGDTEGTGTLSNYGVHFTTTQYTLYRTAYGTSNYTVTLPNTVQVSGSEILFLKGSGEIAAATTVTFTDLTNGRLKTVTINRYGVVTAVN